MAAIPSPPPSDVSVRVFNHIFGRGWQTLLFHGAHVSHGGDTIVTALLGSFNSVVLGVISMLMVWVWITGVGQTAYEGRPLGQSYHSVWTPIRISTSMSLLMPIPWAKGLCLIELILMTFLAHSIGFADQGVNVASKFMTQHGGQVAAPTVHPMKAVSTMQGLLDINVEGQYMRQKDAANISYTRTHPVWHSWHKSATSGATAKSGKSHQRAPLTPGSSSGSGHHQAALTPSSILPHPPRHNAGDWTFAIRTQGLPGKRNFTFGRVSVPCTMGGNSSSCQTRLKSAEMLYAGTAVAACHIVSGDNVAHKTRLCPALSGAGKRNSSRLTIAGYLNNLMETYEGNMQAVYARLAGQQNKTLKSRIAGTSKVMKKLGWVSLGWFYYTIQSFQDQVNSVSQNNPGVTEVAQKTVSNNIYNNSGLASDQKSAATIMHTVETDYNMPGKSVEQSAARGTLVDNGSGTKNESSAWKRFTRWLTIPHTANWVARKLTSTDPLSVMQLAGNAILGGAEATITAFTLSNAAVYAGKSESHSIVIGTLANVFTGGSTSAATGMLVGAVKALAPLLITAVLMLFAAGFTAAYYIPAIPFVVWDIAVISWVLLSLELIVASSVWAAGHAVPGGEGFASEYAKKGYMLALDVLIRPYLMVLGFFFAYLIMQVFGIVFGQGFQIATAGIQSGGFPSMLVANLGFMFIIIGLVLVMTHKVFGSITIFADKIMSWVGSMGASMTSEVQQGHEKFHAVAGGYFSRTESGATSAMRAPDPNKIPAAQGDADKKAMAGQGTTTGNAGGDGGQASSEKEDSRLV